MWSQYTINIPVTIIVMAAKIYGIRNPTKNGTVVKKERITIVRTNALVGRRKHLTANMKIK